MRFRTILTIVTLGLIVVCGYSYSVTTFDVAKTGVSVDISGFAYSQPEFISQEPTFDDVQLTKLEKDSGQDVESYPFDSQKELEEARNIEINMFPEEALVDLHNKIPFLEAKMRIEGDSDSNFLVYEGPYKEEEAKKIGKKYSKKIFEGLPGDWNVLLGVSNEEEDAKIFALKCASYLKSKKVSWMKRENLLSYPVSKVVFTDLNVDENKVVREFFLTSLKNYPAFIKASRVE